MRFDECLEKLRHINPNAAKWVEHLVDFAGTTDADWCVLEQAGIMLSEFDEMLSEQSKNHRSLVERYEAMTKYIDKQAQAGHWMNSSVPDDLRA